MRAWENSMWEGYKRWERKGREVRVLKGWKVVIKKGKLHKNAYYVAMEKWLQETKKRRKSRMHRRRTQETLTPIKSPYNDTLSGLSIERFQSA